MIGRKTIRNFVCQWYMNHVMQWQKFLRKLSNANGFKKRFPALFCENFFMFVLFISNCTVFLIQFEINLHLCRSGSCNFSFLKNSQVQINSKLNSKSYDYLLDTNWIHCKQKSSNFESAKADGVLTEVYWIYTTAITPW